MTEKKPIGAGLVRLLAVGSFTFLLLMPVSQGNLLVGVFGLMVGAALMTFVIHQRVMTLPIMGLAALTFLLAMFGLTIGSNNPGLFNSVGVFIIAPTVYFISISALGHTSLKALMTTCAVMTVVAGVYILVYVGGETGVIGKVIPESVLELAGAGFGEKGEATAIRFYGLSTLAASAPMWLVSLVVKRDAILPTMPLRVAAATAGVAGAMVGGRRAIVLVLVLIPLIAWFVRRFTVSRGTHPIAPTKVLAGIAACIVGIFAFPAILAHPIIVNTWGALVSFFSGTASDASTNESTRNQQADQLIAAWSESPIWGHGMGAIIPGYFRNETQRWQFELQYHSLLMQTGIIGAVLVLVMGLLVLWAIRKATIRRPDMVPTLTVTLCAGIAMLLANATNPYLQAPAHMWAIFLPLAVINVMLRDPAPALTLVTPTGQTGDSKY